jgi:putative ATPase
MDWRIVLDLQMEAPPLQNAYDHKIRDYISQSHLVGPNGSLTQQIIKELFLP